MVLISNGFVARNGGHVTEKAEAAIDGKQWIPPLSKTYEFWRFGNAQTGIGGLSERSPLN